MLDCLCVCLCMCCLYIHSVTTAPAETHLRHMPTLACIYGKTLFSVEIAVCIGNSLIGVLSRIRYLFSTLARTNRVVFWLRVNSVAVDIMALPHICALFIVRFLLSYYCVCICATIVYSVSLSLSLVFLSRSRSCRIAFLFDLS